jgi:uncharacterized protein DUF6502
MIKKKHNIVRRKSRKAALLRAPADSKVISNLAREFYQIVFDTVSQFGLSPQNQRRAFKHAAIHKDDSRPSFVVIGKFAQLGEILRTWHSDRDYRDDDGNLCALPVSGTGRSFEKLARKFLPDVPVQEVVESLCATGEVVKGRTGKLVMVGSPIVIYPKVPEVSLAGLVMQVRLLAGTALHNARIQPGVKGSGRFQRLTYGFMSARDFKSYARSVRPSLQEVCNHVEKLTVGQNARTNRRGRMCGVGIYVFRDTRND